MVKKEMMRTKVLELDISTPIASIKVEDYKNFYILIRSQKKLLGWISFWNVKDRKEISSHEIFCAIQDQLQIEVITHALEKDLQLDIPFPGKSIPISVIVCTRNRTENLKGCCDALLKLDYPDYEIIIVDNAPSTNETREYIAGLPVRYVREERPGLDWARNRGITEARNPIVAFTDDDARVDRYWLQSINRAFSRNEITAVTGFVAPAELETEAQHVFELGYGGMSHGFRRTTFQVFNLDQQQVIRASRFGVGANMAFRKEVFERIGMFDPALDVGTPSHGGGDVEMFFRIVQHGNKLLYDPDVLVWHQHRKSMKGLRKQISDNGRSFGCYLMTCVNKNGVPAGSVLRFLLADWFYRWLIRNMIYPKDHLPRSLLFREFMGMLTSPSAYRASQLRAKKLSSSQPAASAVI